MTKLLMFSELRDYDVTLGRKQIARLEAVGRFPKRVQISDNRIGWVKVEIEAYVKSRIEARAAR